ncbi:MAG: fibronectin/fibrinogen-binding protein, partial [Symbiobacteriaceae bacterium]|nr:fibronectin/fibrinogen-binding protein [Symbiobacteriaceae bacterium]
LLIRSSNPSNSVLEKSARLAAWHSQARESGLVPVDITQRRFLKKPRGARPGFVTYTNQRTVYVTPGNVEE